MANLTAADLGLREKTVPKVRVTCTPTAGATLMGSTGRDKGRYWPAKASIVAVGLGLEPQF